MNRVVFKGRVVIPIFYSTLMCFMIYIAYNLLENNLILLFSIVPVIFLIGIWKNKLFLQDGILRVEKLIRTKEVSLEKVAHMQLLLKTTYDTKEDDTSSNRKTTTRYLCAYDNLDRRIFICSFEYLRKKHARNLFISTVQNINPAITFDLETRFEKIKSRLEEEAIQLGKEHQNK